jgi:outer membrane cobalamin receptor
LASQSFFADNLVDSLELLPSISRLTSSVSAGLEMIQPFLGFNLTVDAHYRLDRIESQEFDSPYLGLSFDRHGPLGFGLEASYSESYRYPPIDALFWKEDVFAIGNPDLRPENAVAREIGFQLDWQGPVVLSARSVWFRSDVADLITWRRRFDGKYQPFNIGTSRNTGNETSLQLSALSDHVEINYSRTSLDARNRTLRSGYYDLLIPFRPDRTERLGLNLKVWRLRLIYDYSFTGKRFIREANTKWLPPYSLHDLSLTFDLNLFSTTQRLRLEVRNLTDKRYELLERMPMPPRQFGASLTMKLEQERN